MDLQEASLGILQPLSPSSSPMSDLDRMPTPPAVREDQSVLLSATTAAETPSTVMPLPSEATYTSLEDLETSINAHARQYNFAFTKGRSSSANKSGRRVITFYCDRYGSPPAATAASHTGQARKRQTSSRKTGCHFSINAKKLFNDVWELCHRTDLKFSVHNHGPSYSATSHPNNHHVAPEIYKMIGEFVEARTFILKYIL